MELPDNHQEGLEKPKVLLRTHKATEEERKEMEQLSIWEKEVSET
jgi:hypothetical protein